MKHATVPTGVAGLDAVLKGGYPRDRVILVEGRPGTGKTTLALQFMLAGRDRGERVMFLSLAQTEAELNMIAVSHDMNLDGVEVYSPDLDAALEHQGISVDTSQAKLRGFMDSIMAKVVASRPQLLVFDSLLEVRLLSSSVYNYRREMLSLRKLVRDQAMTTLLLDHLEANYAEKSVEGIAHGVLRLDARVPEIGISHRRMNVMKMRGGPYIEGHHDMRIVAGGVEVYPRIVPGDWEPTESFEQMGTGIATLDRMLGGGLEFGTVTMIAGQAGSGKSTVATAFASAAARRGQRAALFLFEERPEVFADRACSLGFDLERHKKAGTIRIRHFNPAEISPGEFSQAVMASVEADQTRLVLIDSLTGYLNALPDRENVITHLHTLMQYLSRRGVLVIVTVVQHGLLGEEPRSDLDTSYLADSVILLRQYAEGSEIRRSIAVLKKRQSAHERGIQELVIAPGLVDVKELSIGTAMRASHSVQLGGKQGE